MNRRQKPTPAPWAIADDAKLDPSAWHHLPAIQAKNGGMIAGLAMNGPKGLANARHIVRCVNLFDDLVATLRTATAHVELYTGDGVRRQPAAKYVLPGGSFDAELIAADCRRMIYRIDRDLP